MATIVLRQPAYIGHAAHHDDIAARHLREFFEDDPTRGEGLRTECAGLHLVYSKNHVSDETLRLLIRLYRIDKPEQK